jgi:hypothetical protein
MKETSHQNTKHKTLRPLRNSLAPFVVRFQTAKNAKVYAKNAKARRDESIEARRDEGAKGQKCESTKPFVPFAPFVVRFQTAKNARIYAKNAKARRDKSIEALRDEGAKGRKCESAKPFVPFVPFVVKMLKTLKMSFVFKNTLFFYAPKITLFNCKLQTKRSAKNSQHFNNHSKLHITAETKVLLNSHNLLNNNNVIQHISIFLCPILSLSLSYQLSFIKRR